MRSNRLRLFLYTAAIVPLWVSYLLRAYTWKTILGSEGILNSFLMWIGVINEPSTIFLYNQGAMVVTMAYIFTPFMVMPIYASLEKIPRSLIEASKDLGAPRFTTFRKITLPLSMPGILAGFTFTFGLSIGDFISPILVGGPYSNMIANVVGDAVRHGDELAPGVGAGCRPPHHRSRHHHGVRQAGAGRPDQPRLGDDSWRPSPCMTPGARKKPIDAGTTGLGVAALCVLAFLYTPIATPDRVQVSTRIPSRACRSRISPSIGTPGRWAIPTS